MRRHFLGSHEMSFANLGLASTYPWASLNRLSNVLFLEDLASARVNYLRVFPQMNGLSDELLAALIAMAWQQMQDIKSIQKAIERVNSVRGFKDAMVLLTNELDRLYPSVEVTDELLQGQVVNLLEVEDDVARQIMATEIKDGYDKFNLPVVLQTRLLCWIDIKQKANKRYPD